MDRIQFRTEDGLLLEGELRLPDGPAVASAVLCHPHPRHGGSKDHPLLWTIRNDLAGRGFAVLVFNFRGVMGSDGEYGGGKAEVADVRAAVGVVRDEVDGPTLVCGWSFGAYVALSTALGDDRISALALLGPPLGDAPIPLPDMPGRAELKAFDRPVLLVAGEADQFCPLPELRILGRKLTRATVRTVSDADHFFWRQERETAQIVGDFAEEALQREGRNQ
ncbi:MAG: alpha/beta hydrolase [Actinomycetota bacterium]|nr:alpha/beta hydrolase [Actinomycetota bacterium]